MKLSDLKRYEAPARPADPAPAVVQPAGPGLGTERPSPHGPYCALDINRPAANAHGLHSLAPIASLSSANFARLCVDPELTYADLSRLVFLDTETTGLGMGVGTYVFLVGAGYLDGDTFRVRQFFLRGPGEETAFLHGLAEFLSGFSAIVTFNGKAFDWPLLETRYTYKRRPMPLQDPPHLDLLHPARRLWKRRLPSCALSALERSILHASRSEDDVPGWMIPSLYFQYLRTGDPSLLAAVFYHNLHDILSLAALSVHMQRLADDPFCGLAEHPVDLFSLGVTFERADDRALAAQCYEEALRRGLAGEEQDDCLTRLSTLYKREGLWRDAERVWEGMIDVGGEGALFALVEFAKYYEHVSRDLEAAMDVVSQALNLLDLNPSLALLAARKDLEHRMSRLVARSARGRRTRL